MSKHRLYLPDACSPLSLGMAGRLTPEENDNQTINSKTTKNCEQGYKRRSIMNTPVAQKIVRKEPVSSEPGNSNHPALISNSGTPKPSTSQYMKSETEPTPVKFNRRNSVASSALEDDFDEDELNFMPNSNQKLPYTYQEDEFILKFVLKGQNIFKVSSLSLWRYLEEKKRNPKRTYQSLKNRFLRNIKPHILSTYRHLINDQDTIEKVLLKFPELKTQMGHRNALKIMKVPEITPKTEEIPISNPLPHKYEIDLERRRTAEIAPPDNQPEDVESFFLSSVSFQSSNKTYEKTVTFNRNLIKISVNLHRFKKSEAPISSSRGLSERFKNLNKNNKRVPCPTCGRFYRRPIHDSSESDAESDVLIPDSAETVNSFDKKNFSIILNKSRKDLSRKLCLPSRSSRANSEDSQNLYIYLDKSDKSEEHSEESNHVPEEVSEKHEHNETIDLDDTQIEEIKTEMEDKTTDNDSDIDLIYEHTVARFHKLIDADEEKTLQRKCLNKDRDSIGFNANAEKNLDSFFLDTPLDVETPAMTNDFLTQVQVSSTNTQSQRITRSSSLASNMIKMLGKKAARGKKIKK